jgi:serine/threonine protein kinase
MFCGEQVIDGSGYLKVVDFGSAKRLPTGKKTNTVGSLAAWALSDLSDHKGARSPVLQLCGAAEYIAPEMVLSKGYNKAIDFWAVGVLFFELLTCSTPFAHPNLVSSLCLSVAGFLSLLLMSHDALLNVTPRRRWCTRTSWTRRAW